MDHLLFIFSNICLLIAINLATALIADECAELNVDGRDALGRTNDAAGSGFNLFPDVKVATSGRVKSLNFFTYNTGYAYVSFWKPLGNEQFELVTKVQVNSSQRHNLEHFVPDQHYYVEEGNVVAVHFEGGGAPWNGLIAYETSRSTRTDGVSTHRVYSQAFTDDGWMPGYDVGTNEIGQIESYSKSAALQIEICTCSNNTFGEDCQLCSNNCLELPCNTTNGHCPSGCRDGYQAPMCMDVCDDGTYGPSCSNNCSNNCLNGPFCHPITGACEDGCIPGYYSPMCIESCQNGWYGDNCTSECGSCRDNEPCNSTNGFCENGCADGFYLTNNTCMEECNTGTYGRNCSHNCSDNCNNGTYCHHSTGVCDVGCIWGYYAPMCIESCYGGWYGDNCMSDCGSCRDDEPCNITNGYCQSGCANGYYQTDNCTEPCVSGTYGHNCTERCSGNCHSNSMCDTVEGVCTSGCKAGYDYNASPHCNATCGYARFGASCGSKCYCSDSTACDVTTGTCPQDCASGYTGATCSTRKQKQDSNAASSDVTGWIVAVAILTVLVVVLAVTLTLTCARSWNAVRASLDKTLPAVTTADIQDIILEPVPENIQHQNGRATDSDYETIDGLTTQTPTPVKYETLQIYQNP